MSAAATTCGSTTTFSTSTAITSWAPAQAKIAMAITHKATPLTLDKNFIDAPTIIVKVEKKFSELLNGRLVVAFTTPNAFTKVCTGEHLKSYVELSALFKLLGVDKIACIAVNSFETLTAWQQANDPHHAVTMVPDSLGAWVIGNGLAYDCTTRGFTGDVAAKRSGMILYNGVIKHFAIEEDVGVCGCTSAVNIFLALRQLMSQGQIPVPQNCLIDFRAQMTAEQLKSLVVTKL